VQWAGSKLASSKPLGSHQSVVRDTQYDNTNNVFSIIGTMAAAWHGGLQGYDQYVNSSSLFTAIGNAMDYWFINDFTDVGCLVNGGTTDCPCGTPGYWNTNWYDNVRLKLIFTSTSTTVDDFASRSSSFPASSLRLVFYSTTL
jgi:hypothetical protein